MAAGRIPMSGRSGVPLYVREAIGDGATQVLQNTVAYTDTTAKTLGVLPAGARILNVFVDVDTAFNSSGTDLLDVGKTGTDNHYINDLDVSSVGRKAPTLTNLGSVGTAPVTVTGTFIQSVADASAGVATVTITFTSS